MKLPVCTDGTLVDEKVMQFQLHHKSEDFDLIRKYYISYRKFWFNKVSDLIEEEEFYLEWDEKLLHAVETYDDDRAKALCQLKNWPINSKFNRWFYSSLRNMISNIKSGAFRGNKQPSVICPICLRQVPKIEEQHLKHIISTKDLPKTFIWNCDTYKTFSKPYQKALKLVKGHWQKVKWEWFLKDGTKGVVCPFTMNIVPKIDSEYINTLPKKYKHYAVPYSWFEFQEEFPTAIVHSEIHRIDTNSIECDGRKRSDVSVNLRTANSEYSNYTCEIDMIENTTEYESAMKVIEKYSSDKIDKYIMMCLTTGYSMQDVCEELNISRRDLQNRITSLKENVNLKNALINM